MHGQAITTLMSAEGGLRFRDFVESTASSQMPQCLPMTLFSDSVVMEADLLLVDTGRQDPKYLLGIRADREMLQPEPKAPTSASFPGQAPHGSLEPTCASSLAYSESILQARVIGQGEADRDTDIVSYLSDPASRSVRTSHRPISVSTASQTNRPFVADREVQTVVPMSSPTLRPQRPPLSGSPLRRPDYQPSECPSSNESSASTEDRSGTPMVDYLAPTSLRQCCVSLEKHIQHWNLPCDLPKTCCPLHAALKVLAAAVRKLNRRRCNPHWAPHGGWSCPACTCANHIVLKACAICNTPRRISGSGSNTEMPCLENMEFKFDSVSGEMIDGSASFAQFYGSLPANFYELMSYNKSHNIALLQEIQRQSQKLEIHTYRTMQFQGILVLEHSSGMFQASSAITLTKKNAGSGDSSDDSSSHDEVDIVAHIALTNVTAGSVRSTSSYSPWSSKELIQL